MRFEADRLYHIYNQGNNRVQIFHSAENYKFFLWKMRGYLSPFGDLIAWCLMPNHYHWLFWVKSPQISRVEAKAFRSQVERIRRGEISEQESPLIKKRNSLHQSEELMNFEDAIGLLQSSYTRAINKQRKRSGSLFRSKFKCKDGWIEEFATISQQLKNDYSFVLGNDYGYRCMNYIHNNPVAAKICAKPEDYKWSSASDYAGLRSGSLCNLEQGRKILNLVG